MRWPKGTRVITTKPNVDERHEWTLTGWSSKRWGLKGTIIAVHDSHGVYYDVQHEDGHIGYYGPKEFIVIQEDSNE